MQSVKVLMQGVAILVLISQANADEVSFKRRHIEGCAGKPKEYYPNTRSSILGYNVLKGFPLAKKADPGFGKQHIFEVSYNDTHRSTDCKYALPVGFDIDRQYSCHTSYTSKIIKTSKELRDYLKTTVSVGGSKKGVEFSASVGYEKEVTSIDKSHLTKIESSATCQYFLAYPQITPENKPCFSHDFESKVEQLVREVKNGGIKDSTAYGIFENFGTHYLKQALYGAKYTYMYTMKTSDYNKMVKEGVNVEAAVKYAGEKNSGSIEVSVATEKEIKFSKFEENTKYTTYSYGSVPPSNKDANEWASKVRLHPEPIKYEVDPISDLFDASKFNSKCIKDMFANENDRESIKIGLENKLKTYCQHLKSQGTRVYCTEGEIPTFDRRKPANEPTYRGLIWPTAADY